MPAEALLPADFWFLAIVTGLGGLAWIMRRLEGNWLAPGSFFVGYWTFNLAFCYFAGPAFSVSPAATAWIAVAIMSFAAGALLCRTVPHRTREAANSGIVKAEQLFGIRTGIVFCTSLGLAAIPVMMQWAGESLDTVVSPEGLIAIASEFTVRRYTGEREPAVVSLLLAANYLGALLAGTFAASRPLPKRKVDLAFAWLPLVPALAYSIVTTAKASVLYAGCLWLAAFVVANNLNQRANITAASLAKLVVLVLAAGTAFTAMMALRYGTAIQDLSELTPVLQVYATGHLAAFSYWFDAHWYAIDPKFGLMLFAGIADFFDISPRARGLYEEIVEIGDSGSNVYTAFRVFIEDFGVAGALIFLGLCGWLTAWTFRLARRGIPAALAVVVFAYSLIAWSAVTSITVYNSLLLAFTLYGIYVAFALRRRAVRRCGQH